MEPIWITLTIAQREALMHRLELGDCIAEVFQDTEYLTHFSGVEDRAREMVKSVYAYGYLLVHDCELDKAILTECIEGSTYLAMFDPMNHTKNTAKGLKAAERVLKNLRKKIADALNIPETDIQLPSC